MEFSAFVSDPEMLQIESDILHRGEALDASTRQMIENGHPLALELQAMLDQSPRQLLRPMAISGPRMASFKTVDYTRFFNYLGSILPGFEANPRRSMYRGLIGQLLADFQVSKLIGGEMVIALRCYGNEDRDVAILFYTTVAKMRVFE